MEYTDPKNTAILQPIAVLMIKGKPMGQGLVDSWRCEVCWWCHSLHWSYPHLVKMLLSSSIGPLHLLHLLSWLKTRETLITQLRAQEDYPCSSWPFFHFPIFNALPFEWEIVVVRGAACQQLSGMLRWEISPKTWYCQAKLIPLSEVPTENYSL